MPKKVIFTNHDDSILKSYLRDISKYKILDNNTIIDLVKDAQNGNLKSRELVVTSNLRFVVTIAKQFQNRGIPLMDLIADGNAGLLKAIDKYDPKKGVMFISYAVWWIKQSIYNAIYWQGKEIRLPMSQQLLVTEIMNTTNKFMQEHNRTPSSEEISIITGIPISKIDYLSQFSNKLVSVDDFIGGDEENNQICDIIPDGEAPLEDIINKQYVISEIEKCLNKLSIREHDLLKMYFGIGMNEVNSKTICDMFGVGKERIRQMKEIALDKLKEDVLTILKIYYNDF